jgi:hypothetical protein
MTRGRDDLAELGPGALARRVVDHDLPLMITRHVEPATFTSNLAVPFVVLEDLATVLQADSEPAAGQVWPASGLPLEG